MSEVYQNETDINEIQSEIKTKKDVKKQVKKWDPISVFPNNTKAARFWFFCTIALLVFVIIQPSLIIQQMKIKERVIIMDESGTFHVSPVKKFEDVAPMHDYIVSVATQAMLNRGPLEVDNPPLLKQVFLPGALKEVRKFFKDEEEHFRKKKLHQKAEIKELKILKTTTNTVLASVKGQLIRVGTFEGQKFTDTKEFSLKIQLNRNPRMHVNGRLPMAVKVFKIKTRAFLAVPELNEEPIETIKKTSEKPKSDDKKKMDLIKEIQEVKDKQNEKGNGK
jgi:hypothetical protein